MKLKGIELKEHIRLYVTLQALRFMMKKAMWFTEIVTAIG